jgi:hypothetical protein
VKSRRLIPISSSARASSEGGMVRFSKRVVFQVGIQLVAGRLLDRNAAGRITATRSGRFSIQSLIVAATRCGHCRAYPQFLAPERGGRAQ